MSSQAHNGASRTGESEAEVNNKIEDATAEVSNKTATEDSTAEVNNKTATEGSTAEVNNKTATEDSTAEVSNKTAIEDSTAEVNNKTATEGSTAEVNNKTATEDSTAEVSNKTAGAITEESNKTDDATATGPLEDKIIRQIEYYFGDRNMPRDKFLQQAAAAGQDGFVPISVLLTFNRLKALSSNEQLIAMAVKKSHSSIIELNADETAIRRNPSQPLPDIFSPDLRKLIKCKTVYVKGFPQNVTLDQLQSFFEGFGKVEHIHMRRLGEDEGRKFKGSIFVEFKEKTDAEQFLGNKAVSFEGLDLIKESKELYVQRKNEERKALKVQHAQSVQESIVKQKNCVLHFKGCGPNATWEAIKEQLNEYVTVAFVEFSDSERSEGYVRFKEEGGADQAIAALTRDDKKPLLLGEPTELRVLKDAEEVEYWTKLERDKKPKTSGVKGRSGGFKGRGGYKRKGREQPLSTKQVKTED